jgi:hypothetical protein
MPRARIVNNEPKFSGEVTKSEISNALSWYSQNKDNKDSQKYALEFLKKKHKLDAKSIIKKKPSTFGFVCRIVLNGAVLPVDNQTWLENEVELIKKELDSKVSEVDEDKKEPVVNIQDRIRERASECIGELEGALDELVSSGFKANVSPYAIFHTLEIKSVHVRHILESIKKRRTEFDFVLNTDDKEVKEAYSNFTKPQLKKLIAFCDQTILDCEKITQASVKNRKPRKRKEKSADQLVAKVKFCDEFKELNLKSVDVKSVLGAMQLWVYNTKTRKLGCYHANDAGGFSIKGTTIQNFNESKSIQKKLRKPEISLPEVLNGGKVALRNFMDGIRAVESLMNGRLNVDTILLRIVK